MTQRNTKEKIFYVSLELFSQKGFNNTSVRQIAREVGIKESSIYNHYPSKQAILDEILKTFQNQLIIYDADEALMDELLEKDPLLFYKTGSGMFRQQLKNEKAMKILRLLFIQMYHDDSIAEYFYDFLFQKPLEFWTSIFDKLIENGIVKDEFDPAMLAREYYAYPMFLLMEIFIQNNSFPDEDLDELFKQSEEHVNFILKAVMI